MPYLWSFFRVSDMSAAIRKKQHDKWMNDNMNPKENMKCRCFPCWKEYCPFSNDLKISWSSNPTKFDNSKVLCKML